MTTVHEEGARRAVRTWLKNSDASAAFAEFEERLRGGDLDVWFVEAVGQIFRLSPAEWPLEQVLMLTKVHMDVLEGKVGLVDVCLWDTPHRDSERRRNQAALNDLPDPFKARVDERQYGADSDGWLEWSEPIRVEVATGRTIAGPSGRPLPILEPIMLPPRGVPLEIGATRPSRTLLHIREGFGVARWPYGRDKVRIFLNIEHLSPEHVWSRDVLTQSCTCHESIAAQLPRLGRMAPPESLRDEPLPHATESE